MDRDGSVEQTSSAAAAASAGERIAAPRRARFGKRRIATLLFGLLVVVGTFAFVLPKIADYRDVWDVVRELSWPSIAALLAATLLNLATYAPPWQVALPGLRFRQAFVLTQASTASTYIAPGGAAVGVGVAYAMLRAWRFAGRAVTVAVTLTGVWNQLALLAFPLVALALLSATGEENALLRTVALVALVVFAAATTALALAFSSPALARGVGDLAARFANYVLRIVRKGPVRWSGQSLVRFREETIELLRRRWHLLTVAILAGQLTVFVVLLVSLRVLEVSSNEVSVIEAFAAWSLVRLLGSLPVTPGGIGIVELGLTTALVGFGGRNAEVVAAVLVWRFLTIVPTLVLGLVLGATWRRHRPAA